MDDSTVEAWDAGPGLLESVWQYRWVVAGSALLAGLLGFGVSFLQPIEYEAEASLLLTDPRTERLFDSAPVPLDATRYVQNRTEYATSTPVFAEAREGLGADIALDDLRERVTVTPAAEADVLMIRATGSTPESARMLADAMGQAYQAVASRQAQQNAEDVVAEMDESSAQLQAAVDIAESRLDRNPEDVSAQAERDAAVAQLIELESRARQIRVEAALSGSGVELFEQAELPESPSQPKPLRNAVLAVVLGVMGAAAFAWWRAEHTQTADSRQDAAPVLRAPLLGEVPDFSRVGVAGGMPTLTAPHSAAGEAYQFLVAAVGFALQQVDGRTVVLTSAGPADGKTVTAMNIAVAAVRDGRRTLLVDADDRMRGLTRLTRVSPEPGLTDLADAAIPFRGCLAALPVGPDTQLQFIPAGSKLQDPAGFFRSAGFRQAMLRAKDQADLVVVDTPPLLAVADSSAIATHADGIVLVVSRGTPLRQLEEVRERLEFIGAPLLGYVFNRADLRHGRGGYGYGYGYGYGEPSNGSDGRREDVDRRLGTGASAAFKS